ncbi:alpha/beta hydrolase [Streptomyces sp. S.PNR 29]|uniref:alpha/beta fold hydrolase n=1 Tax=Streptomyces sp. S.PNR 29 TaxID=2973805 RepID=UPI0025AFD191|nr:alpha/beta hydrolase [Streptomyces sp. S.PNR 29]MDN0197624.1 alpha/beta hydrolase [Streptomyces sp. S.PNR 29]
MTARNGDTIGTAHITTPDGVALRVRSAGDPSRPVVLIASACGMPAELCDAWLAFLGRDHHALTWETRGLFGGPHGTGEEPEAFDAMGHRVVDQISDILAILDHYQVPRAHLMGLCGGAVLALRMAAEHADRVASTSLWHGDFDLGADSPKTSHQRNLQALMEIAAESRQSAAMVHGAVPRNATADLPPDVADLVLHPFRDAETFYRYSLLNGALMAEDIRGALPRVKAPALVVTSEDDQTAHPAGSHAVAAALARSRLHVEPHGDHLSVFRAGDGLTAVAGKFLTETGTP